MTRSIFRHAPYAGWESYRFPSFLSLLWTYDVRFPPPYQHGRVEKYDKTGKNHKGEYDPETGEQTKAPDPGRSTPKFNTPQAIDTGAKIDNQQKCTELIIKRHK